MPATAKGGTGLSGGGPPSARDRQEVAAAWPD